ncbi:hypothetical protein, variant [Exophiala dermatitidis NIH/UT8656]|uniref:Uncharacterized protein n=1 Tax=Exophiala dermatitidis (strain ATCC 34100 / CBS 525.76 / NIH/UT8656) TaxID=858893 RepID=H6CA13_EXODN|nr:uncharacterized protein HMPREF1120_07953 [Exophiala dermatitidis NIH/UT8656]XP_009160439.1 hypothetical protein, variant [Exophiala dermatitidis NIH/UT8656]EHY59977.1 hypothetical protein, variant [Exophiala dermatitidis NIH/UT8656]EHY59978.1 hypothetical protein HMPREF1120_07953 [Exophiala dermatitidis NIH/UT8656]
MLRVIYRRSRTSHTTWLSGRQKVDKIIQRRTSMPILVRPGSLTRGRRSAQLRQRHENRTQSCSSPTHIKYNYTTRGTLSIVASLWACMDASLKSSSQTGN